MVRFEQDVSRGVITSDFLLCGKNCPARHAAVTSPTPNWQFSAPVAPDRFAGEFSRYLLEQEHTTQRPTWVRPRVTLSISDLVRPAD